MKLYAVRIFVRQWSEACAFYGAALGLKERYRNDEIGWAEYEFEGAGGSPGGGPCLGLERVEPGDSDGEAMTGRFLAVSLQVDDIDDTYRSLSNKGVPFTAPPERQAWGGSLAHFRDPDGNVLTLLG